MNFGSLATEKVSPTRLVFATTTKERACLKQRSMALEAEFRTAPLSSFADTLSDLRRLHRLLYDQLCPALPIAVGTYRGTPNTALANARREVRIANPTANMRAVDPCVPPQQVPVGMERLTVAIAELVQAPQTGDGLAVISKLTYDFLTLHPFLDGNGHTWRLALIGLARVAGMQVRSEWTVCTRPFGVEFSAALQNYLTEPCLLNAELGRFFETR